MEATVVKATITGIEEEIKVLKAQLAGLGEKVKKKFSSLKGLWRGKVSFSFEDIKNAEIKLKEEL